MNNLIALETRAILEISGIDRKKFLQGLITNDVNLASKEQLIYSAMLNSVGRFLYDFFIFDDGEKLFLDCQKSRRDEILKKFSFYKLKSQIQIQENNELQIYFCREKNIDKNVFQFSDPRCQNFGYRIYSQISKKLKTAPDETDYNFWRILNKIAEGENDLTYEKSIIAEFNFDNLNAINYQKGCYIGQELTARTHYMGQVRKKIFHIKIITQSNKVEKNCEISCAGKNVGVVLSSVFYENNLYALALIKIDEHAENIAEITELTSEYHTANGDKIIILA